MFIIILFSEHIQIYVHFLIYKQTHVHFLYIK